MSMMVSAQTQVPVTTTGGTVNNVPVYSGVASLGASPISISNGNVGIGTTTPLNKLQVAGGRVYVGGDATGSDYAQFGKDPGNNAFFDATVSGASIGFYTNYSGSDTSRLQILANGNVGIGTTAPNTALEVVGPGSTSVQNVIAAFNPVAGAQALNSGAAVIMGNNGGAYYAKIAAIFESQNPDYLRPALAFFTMDSSYLPGSEVERMRIKANGNVGIGTTSPGTKLEVNGSVKLTANSGASITFADGTTQSTAFTGVLCGGDYAESVDPSGERAAYTAGDVLILDEASPGKIAKSTEAYSTLVAGVYSTKPGVVGRRQTTPKTDSEVPMAMVGIVPTKVSTENGPIHVGDLLVSSSKAGYAMRGTDRGRMLGAVLGKAMNSLESRDGVIEVLVTLQ